MKKISRRSFLKASAVGVGALCVAACTNEPASSGASSQSGAQSDVEQVLTVSMAGAPTDLSPLTSTTNEASELIGAMYETLVRQDANGKTLEGSGLAEKIAVNEDKTVYTFTLRDATWSDGTPITAQQFEYAWTKALEPATAATYSYIMYPILNAAEFNAGDITDASELGIKALDHKTLEVTLVSDTPYFISSLVMPIFGAYPVGMVEEKGMDFFTSPEHMVFNGPFVMTEWAYDQKMVFEKNPNYWDKENVSLDKLIFDFAAETNTVVSMYETGSIDVMKVQPEYIGTYKDAAGFVALNEPVTLYLKYNFDNEFFANKNIRSAFGMALNRESLVNDFLRNGSSPAYGFIPNSILGVGGKSFRENLGDLYYDCGNNENAAAEALELLNTGLAELGKTVEDLNKELVLVIGEGDENLKSAQVYQEAWKNVLGVDVTVNSTSYALRTEAYDNRAFTMGHEGWGADYNDPMSFLDLFETGGYYNDTGYSSEAYDALLAEVRNSTGDERLDLLQQCEVMLVVDDVAIAPTSIMARQFVAKDYVQGIIRNGIGLRTDYKFASVTK